MKSTTLKPAFTTVAQFRAAALRKGALVVLCVALSALALGGAHKPTFTTFDAPSAGTAGGAGTHALTINPTGTIVGWYFDVNFVFHGFVRAPDGSFNTFDAPGAGTAPSQGTGAFAFNPEKTETRGTSSNPPTLANR